MLNNPFEQNTTTEKAKDSPINLQKESQKLPLENTENSDVEQNLPEPLADLELPPLAPLESGEKYVYTPVTKEARINKREAVREMTSQEYRARLDELNTNADNKHYVLFFGQPASGKTWIIASILYYMKRYLDGMVYLDSAKTADSELDLFYQLQNYFDGSIVAGDITSTDTRQYFELHMSFTPKDSNKPPLNIVFVDASGEHSEGAFRTIHDRDSGSLPDYLTVILESDVKTKLAFVYDQSLRDEKGGIPQVNILNEIFTQIQLIQNNQKRVFPKALILSKADKIEARDFTTLEQCGYDATNYAQHKIPQFANSFFNESSDNVCILYKIGTFSTVSDNLMQFDKDCPERLFNWLYRRGTDIDLKNKPNCWQKFTSWFKGEH